MSFRNWSRKRLRKKKLSVKSWKLRIEKQPVLAWGPQAVQVQAVQVQVVQVQAVREQVVQEQVVRAAA